MRFVRSACGLAAAAQLFQACNGVLVTVTQTKNNCTTDITPQSTTFIPSTVTVEPAPASSDGQPGSGSAVSVTTPSTPSNSAGGGTANIDSSIAGGSSFVLGIPSSSLGMRKRQSPPSGDYFITPAGNLTQDQTQAAVFSISNSMLMSGNGHLSTNPDNTQMSFAVPATDGTISTTFLTTNGTLNWNNGAFDGSAARFFRTQGTVPEQVQIVVLFHGDPSANLISITMSASLGTGIYKKRCGGDTNRSSVKCTTYEFKLRCCTTTCLFLDNHVP